MANENEFRTFEELEAYVDKLNAEPKKAIAAEGAQADLAGSLQQVCKYYKVIKPILQVVLNLPLIPEKIKKPIKEFMAIMDTVCP